ncbi:hypothetical protein An08g09790 [Aspergillus niger]|uniref:Uncharacterized protein n=2 Tax=Aspergillus niger TaxID=5061 RepID=A5ABC2_ASPNC|nr:hypothetical protein An08g09790 [Aspergillus niger]CAK96756.1 hypothetical protein An08g09790 [Aspergillus niger]
MHGKQKKTKTVNSVIYFVTRRDPSLYIPTQTKPASPTARDYPYPQQYTQSPHVESTNQSHRAVCGIFLTMSCLFSYVSSALIALNCVPIGRAQRDPLVERFYCSSFNRMTLGSAADMV